jgi:hypothetical protein
MKTYFRPLKVIFCFLLITLITLFFSSQKIFASDLLAINIEGSGGAGDPFYRIEGTLEQRREEHEEIVEEGNPSLEVFVNNTLTNAQLQTLTNILGPVNEESEDSKINGAVPGLTNLIAEMYHNKPASTHVYVADLMQSAKIIPQTQAQGLGFSALNPILGVWKTFRNISYFLFVIIFIVIGFMIMLRHKISGQTVVTIEQAVPNIIVALLFVTFSYAIAGLMIDFMYLIMYLIIGLFSGSADMMNYNIIKLGQRLITEAVESPWKSDAVKVLVGAAGLHGGVYEFITSLTLAVILAIAVLFGVFKLFLELLKSYISIILSVSFSPIFLMIGAIPGQNAFGKWFKNLVGNLAAFPAVLLLLLVQTVIKENTSMGKAEGGFMPPFLLGAGFGGALPAVVAIGILLAMPEVVKKIKETIGASEGVFGELAGEAGKRVKSAEIGIPVASSLATAIPGGAVAGYKSWKGGTRNIKTLYKDVLHGYKEESGEAGEPPVYHGGIVRRGKVGWQAGSKVRKQVDRLSEGRWGQAEDIETNISQLLERAKRSSRRNESSQDDQGEEPDETV